MLVRRAVTGVVMALGLKGKDRSGEMDNQFKGRHKVTR
jgi:hypothetical protein